MTRKYTYTNNKEFQKKRIKRLSDTKIQYEVGLFADVLEVLLLEYLRRVSSEESAIELAPEAQEVYSQLARDLQLVQGPEEQVKKS